MVDFTFSRSPQQQIKSFFQPADDENSHDHLPSWFIFTLHGALFIVIASRAP
jgi:hypothetical protein